LEDDLAHGDRLDQEAVLRVALGRPLERLDRIGIVAEPPVGLAGALGPLRVVGLEALELEVGGECALVLAGRDSGCGLFAQCSTVLRHRLDADYRSERGARGLRRKYAPQLTLSLFFTGLAEQIARASQIGLRREAPQLVLGMFRSRQRRAVLGDGALE